MIAKTTQFLFILVALFVANSKVNAQASITEGSNVLDIDFSNSMPTTVGSNPSTAFTGAGFDPNTANAGKLNSNAWSVLAATSNSFNYGGTGGTTTFARGVASSSVSTSGIYAYTGAPYSAGNPCMMIQPANSVFQSNGYITLKIKNEGTTNITSFDFSYDLSARLDGPRSSFFNGQYSTNGTIFTDPSGGELEYISPAASTGTNIVSVLNVSGNPFLVTINTVTIAPNDFLYLRWKISDVGGSSTRDEFYLDNIHVKCYYQQIQLRTSYCGYLAQSFGEFIGADSVVNATDYKFTLDDGLNPPEEFINSSGYPYLTLYTIPGMSYNNEYNVTVQYSTDNGATYSSPGAVCTITAPATATTQLEGAYLPSYAPASVTDIIRADLVSGATQYEFLLENAALGYSQSLVKNNNNFNLSQFTGLVPGQTYSVSVRVNIFGAFNVYGPTGDVIVPNPMTSLSAGSCGSSPGSYNQTIYADILPGATQYEFFLTNASLGYSQSLVKNNANFMLNQFTGLVNSTTYTVNVSAYYNGSWTTLGPNCNITTPILSTSLTASNCGLTASSYSQYFTIDPLVGAATYKIRLFNTALSYTQTITKVSNNFSLVEFTGLTANTSYSVGASGYVGGAYTPAGAICSITTPATAYSPTTQLSPSSCGITPSLMSSILFANAVTGAIQYEYLLTNTSLGYSQSFVKTNNNFNLAQFTGLTNGSTYTVQVRVDVGSGFGAYGAECNVTVPSIIPTTALSVGSCNSSPATYTTILFADPIVGATQYEYRLTSSALSYSQIFAKTNNNFNLSQFTGLQTSATYTVRIRVTVGGTAGAFGPTCTITTPSSYPTTQLSAGSCNSSPATFTTTIFADGVAGATQYEYLLTNTSLGYSQSFVKSNANFNLSQFTGLALSTTYSVQVRANVFGSFGPYGSICTVTTPASFIMMSPSITSNPLAKVATVNNEQAFEAMVYPNPFENAFAVNLLSYYVEGLVTITIYDATGKLIETKILEPSEVSNYAFGSGYASGLYNIVASQGDAIKSIKVLKP